MKGLPPLNLEPYQRLRETGMGAEEISRVAVADGLGMVETIRLMCLLFPLSLADAKELVHAVRYGATEYQAHIEAVATTLEQVAEVLEYEAQIGRHLTDAEAEAYLHRMSAEN